MIRVIAAIVLLVVTAQFAVAHKKENIPCDVTIMSTLMMFKFNTFETTDPELLALPNGRYTFGIEMEVKGENKSFKKNFTPTFKKYETSFDCCYILSREDRHAGDFSNQFVSKDTLEALGDFPSATCNILGITPSN